MIQGKILSFKDDIREALDIRRKVFVEEVGIPEELEFDERDAEAIHVVVYEGTQDSEKARTAIATGRIIYLDDHCYIEKVAVLKEYRHKKYGDFVVRMLINRAFTAGINKVYVDSEAAKELFFRKIGFQRISNEYLEDNILKYKMMIEQKSFKTPCGNRDL